MAALRIMLVACAFAASCARSPGLTAVEHDAVATEHERIADSYNRADTPPDRRIDPQRCIAQGRGVVCWSMFRNPTSANRKAADHHRQVAAAHRAASESLRSAEAEACAGLSSDDRDIPALAQREDIVSVAPLRESPGAVVTFRAVPGLTQDRLERVVDCELARSAVLGDQNEGMRWDPLAVPGVRASVAEAPSGFTVTIEAGDAAAGANVLERARALQSAGS